MSEHDESASQESPPKQRRNSFRVILLHPAEVRMDHGQPARVEVTDLSGSGCSFVLRSAVAVGDTGTVSLDLDGKPLVAGIVVRMVRHDKRVNIVGAQFECLPKPDAERIAKAVFVQQRHQLRRTRTGHAPAGPSIPS